MSRVLNEVWRVYEMKHKPACFLHLVIPAGNFDVNLTPDKVGRSCLHLYLTQYRIYINFASFYFASLLIICVLIGFFMICDYSERCLSLMRKRY